MRADRLLAELILLQSRGRMTAQALAEELEVSVRTIYRDIDALSAAGVPVYTERGPGGGCALLDDYQTNLTGLNEAELRALFLLNVPASLADLGMMEDLHVALQKFSATLSKERREQQMWVQQRVHLDWSWWQPAQEPVPFMRTIQQAVWEDRKLRLRYQMQLGPSLRYLERDVAPLGLVAKAGIWYVVGSSEGRTRVYRMSELAEATLLDETFERSPEFDLASFWTDWCAVQKERPYPVRVRVAPALLPYLHRFFSDRLQTESERTPRLAADGWATITLAFTSLEAARARLLGFGGAIEVEEPEALRRSVADYASQIVAIYA